MTQETLEPPDADRYREAGVDIDAGEALVRAIAPLARSTARPGASAEIGGFGGLFDLRRPAFATRSWSPRPTASAPSCSFWRRAAGIASPASTWSRCASTTSSSRAPSRCSSSTTSPPASSMPEQAARGDRGDRRGLPRGALRADRRRDRRDAGPLQAGRLRPRGLRGRRGRAGLAPAARPTSPPATSSSASPPAASTPTASRWSARSCATVSLALPDPAPFAPDESLASALLVPTRIYVRSLLSLLGHTRRRQGDRPHHRRRPDRQPAARAARRRGGADRREQLARAAGVPLAVRGRPAEARGDAAHLQLRHRHGAGGGRRLRRCDASPGSSERGETVYRLGELIPGEGPARVRIDGMDA